MSFQATSFTTVIHAVAQLIRTDLPTVKLLESFPNDEGIQYIPSIVLQQPVGSSYGSAQGEIVKKGTKGHTLRILIQIDIYADTDADRKHYVNRLTFAIWKGTENLRANGIRFKGFTRIGDMGSEVPGERVYRHSMDALFEIEMLRPA